MKNIYLTVVIPCYNEEKNIRLGALEKVVSYLIRKKFAWEVILVDDGSIDESRKLIKEFIKEYNECRLVHRNHQGKAGAVITGVLEANGKIILFTDLDQATPIDQLEKILPWFEKGYDLVIGSRNTDREGAPIFRRAMAFGFILLRNIILNLGISDTQCGFKAFTKKAAYKIFPRLKLYNIKKIVHGSTVTAGFDVELLYLAKILGFKIAEVPVEWHYQETRHVNPLKESITGLIDLLKIRWYTIKGEY